MIEASASLKLRYPKAGINSDLKLLKKISMERYPRNYHDDSYFAQRDNATIIDDNFCWCIDSLFQNEIKHLLAFLSPQRPLLKRVVLAHCQAIAIKPTSLASVQIDLIPKPNKPSDCRSKYKLHHHTRLDSAYQR